MMGSRVANRQETHAYTCELCVATHPILSGLEVTYMIVLMIGGIMNCMCFDHPLGWSIILARDKLKVWETEYFIESREEFRSSFWPPRMNWIGLISCSDVSHRRQISHRTFRKKLGQANVKFKKKKN